MKCPTECPAKVSCLVSGGKDSVTTAHVLAAEGRLERVVFIDTGIATPDLFPFVEKLCSDMAWPLEVIRTPKVYEELVLKFGFPGPAQHFLFMSLLKGRAIRAFRRAHPGEVLASGVRSKESARRLTNAKEWSLFEGVWVYAPILSWPTEKVWDYVKRNGLPRSPAYKTLHISGDCLCGAFASPREVHLLEMFYPAVAARLKELERLTAGRKVGAKWGWGEGFGSGQTKMESFVCQSCTAPDYTLEG